MGFVLKLLGGSLGPYIAGAVGVNLAASLASAGVQTARLTHAKADLSATRDALKAASGALRRAADAIRDRDDALTLNAAQEASDASELASVYKGAARDAFKAGLSSCPRRPGEPVGVRDDLKALWSAGAFKGSVGVSGEPRSGH